LPNLVNQKLQQAETALIDIQNDEDSTDKPQARVHNDEEISGEDRWPVHTETWTGLP